MSEPQSNGQTGLEVQPDEVIANGDTHASEDQLVNGEEEQLAPQPVTILLPTPFHPRTLPKAMPSSLSLVPGPNETIQELKLAVNEWAGGYWLGPYSLRVPSSSAAAGKQGEGKLLGKGKDGVEVREGDRLSEWLEVGDVFGESQDEGERKLEVVREPYSDFTARQTVLRLLELISPPGSSSHNLTTSLAVSPGSTIFESIRSGAYPQTETLYEEVEVALPSGRKGKGGKKELVKVRKEVDADHAHAFADWTGKEWVETRLADLPFSQPPIEVQACLKKVELSAFNPPPPQLRQRGHQLYVQVTTLENESLTLVCSSRGWYVSKTSGNTFDPSPRDASAQPVHSLLDLLHYLSPLFSERLSHLSPLSATPPPLEPISTVPIPQAEPAYPWLVTPPKPPTSSEILRSQLAYLHTGATGAEGLDGARDWNEEIQGVRELPRDSMQERVVREKMAMKTWGEFTSASIRGVMAVARGDIPALNPNEPARAHMFLNSNIFITKALDSIDAYKHLGGDAAAHVSHSKDAMGVKALNKLDVDGVCLLGHTVVDWMGERWVCQSVLPGIFGRRREEDPGVKMLEEQAKASADKADEAEGKKEDWVKVGDSPAKPAAKVEAHEEEEEEIPENHLIVYGLDSEHLTSIHHDAATHALFSRIAEAYHLAPHKVKDGKGEEFEFYASVEVKGLKGTDGRRYLLDLPRLAPVDVEWLENDMDGEEAYPHRVVLLRQELVEQFWEGELKRWARGVAAEDAKKREDEAKVDGEADAEGSKDAATVTADKVEEDKLDGEEKLDSPAAQEAAERVAESTKPVDTSRITQLKSFDLRLNPDAFVDQPLPKKEATDSESSSSTSFVPSKVTDLADPAIRAVRDASVFLRQIAIPAFALDCLTGNLVGVMDGASLSRGMHSKGINMRYLGELARTCEQFGKGEGVTAENGHLRALKRVVFQEIALRASKHVLRRLIAGLQPEHAPCAISHFLNCLFGSAFNPSPSASYVPLGLSDEPEPTYVSLTPASLREQIRTEAKRRFRYDLPAAYFADEEEGTEGESEMRMRKRQLLRELATRVAFQLVQREYAFEKGQEGEEVEGQAQGGKKDKKEKKKNGAVERKRETTFEPEDVVCLVPVVKSTAPSVSVAEEIFEAGRQTLNRGNIDLGLEFLLESVQLYENIHSVIHPEVAAAYNQYATTMHQLARLKISQLSQQQSQGETVDPEQPLGLDISTALRLQRQAVTIAERTCGVYSAEAATYYLNLAMLENLEGNAKESLRYFRHVIRIWEVVFGPGHPEVNTVLSNAAVVLQSLQPSSQATAALSHHLLQLSHSLTASQFGPDHLLTAQALNQLTQAHFLAGDIPKALESAEQAHAVFAKRLGEDNAQTKEVGKNVELLKAVVESVKRREEMGKAEKERQFERLRAAQARVGGGSVAARRRLGAVANGTALGSGAGVPEAEASRIGERGHLDVDELVKFIQGGQTPGGQGSAASRGKNSLRGKRRTGAKR